MEAFTDKGITGMYFQTIESILKQPTSPGTLPAASWFPDYWVYFKAPFQIRLAVLLYPYFQTIESILKRDRFNTYFKCLTDFQTIESILKLRIIKELEKTLVNFQTIESILKLTARVAVRSSKSWFPDYWVYFKA